MSANTPNFGFVSNDTAVAIKEELARIAGNQGTINNHTAAIAQNAAGIQTINGTVGKIKDILFKYNSNDYGAEFVKESAYNVYGIDFVWTGDTCVVSGETPSDHAAGYTLLSKRSLPDNVRSGDTLYVQYSTTDANVLLRILWYDENDSIISAETRYFPRSRNITVPVGAVDWSVGLYVDKDVTLSDDVVAGDIAILTAPGNLMLEDEIARKAALAISVKGDMANGGDCDLVNENSIYFVSTPSGSYSVDHWPLARGGYLVTTVHQDGNFRLQMAFSAGNAVNPVVRTYLNSSWNDWRDYIEDAVDMLASYNSCDVAAKAFTKRTGTSNGITYTWNGDVCTAGAGTATNTSANVLAPENASDIRAPLPSEINPGHLAAVKYQTTDPKVYLRIIFYDSGDNRLDLHRIAGDQYVQVPATATKWNVALCVNSGTVLESDVTVSEIKVLTAPTNIDLADQIQFLKNNDIRSIRLLVFGNSYSYSTLGYLPLVLKEIAPNVNLTLGILYKSGAKISDHIDYFDDDTPYSDRPGHSEDIHGWYSEYTSESGAWNNQMEITSKQVLNLVQWDYIVMQEACRTMTPDNMDDTPPDIETLADKIVNYVDYPVEFLANIQQAAHANWSSFPEYYSDHYSTGEEMSDANFAIMASFYSELLDGNIISDVLPGGTAVQNARQLDVFKSIGTDGEGYLAYDDTGHLKNGIGPLISAYAVAYKLLSLIGYPRRIFAAYSSDLDPTDNLLTAYNYAVGPDGWYSHGSCVGVTKANKLLASKCALMAVKKPFEISEV